MAIPFVSVPGIRWSRNRYARMRRNRDLFGLDLNALIGWRYAIGLGAVTGVVNGIRKMCNACATEQLPSEIGFPLLWLALGLAILWEGVLGFRCANENRELVVANWAVPMVTAGLGFVVMPIVDFLIRRRLQA